MDLSVKVPQEQVTLMKKAIKLLQCNTGGECSSQKNQSAQAEDLEEVNLQLQKLHMDLMQQALSLKTDGKEKKAPTKWYRTHSDQQQQTDQVSVRPENQDKDSAVSELQLQKQEVLEEEEAANNQKYSR